MTQIKLGKYVHFKGKEYEVIGKALNSETLEEMVLYKPLYDFPGHRRDVVFVRPAKMFFEEIERENYKGPRFKLIE